MTASQRKAFTDDQGTIRELDKIYKGTNQPLLDKRIFKNYTATQQDTRLSLQNAGIVVTLPALGQQAHGFILFVQDRSKNAEGTPAVILANTGKTINGLSSVALIPGYGFCEVQWDYNNNAWFKTSYG